MVRYMSTLSFTAQGIQDLKHSPRRAEEFKGLVEKAGGKVLFQYWAVGEADGCFVFEAPNETVAAQLLLRLGQQGNVRTKSMQVFNADEFAKIASGS